MSRADLGLDPSPGDDVHTLAEDAALARHSLPAALELAERTARWLPLPGSGATLRRWDALARVAAVDLTVARVLEPHLDAVAILAEAGMAPEDGTWGVFASEGSGARLEARPAGTGHTLKGTKQWCSLASVLDRALVTAEVEGGRQLFSVDLHDPSVHPAPADTWVARGLTEVTSAAVYFDDAPARAVGGVAWYLHRPGFHRGGIGVAACWYGGAAALHDHLAATGRDDDIGLMLLGRADRACWAAAAVLRAAAATVDEGDDDGLLAARARSVVAAAAEDVVRASASSLGPAPLGFDEIHAKRVADLEMYLRQHHGERDLAAQARMVRR